MPSCSVTASFHFPSFTPKIFTPMPLPQSRYSLPSQSYSLHPFPSLNTTGKRA